MKHLKALILISCLLLIVNSRTTNALQFQERIQDQPARIVVTKSFADYSKNFDDISNEPLADIIKSSPPHVIDKKQPIKLVQKVQKKDIRMKVPFESEYSDTFNYKIIKEEIDENRDILKEENISILKQSSDKNIAAVNNEYYVQVGSWKNEEYANEMFIELNKHYPDVNMVEQNNFYKVRISGVLSYKRAAMISKKIKRKFNIMSLVVLKEQNISLAKTQEASPEKEQNITLAKTQEASPEKEQNITLAKTQEASPEKEQNITLVKTQEASPEKEQSITLAKAQEASFEKEQSITLAKAQEASFEKEQSITLAKTLEASFEKEQSITLAKTLEASFEKEQSITLAKTQEASFEKEQNTPLTKTQEISFDKEHNISLADAVRPFIGTSYTKMNCYGLIVMGLINQGIQYHGRGGLRRKLENLALLEGLPNNAYLNGEGLVEKVGKKIYSNSIYKISNTRKATDTMYSRITPYLREGLILSFSTTTRGHTGIVSSREDIWTYINSGVIDNQVSPSKLSKGVGEEFLKAEIKNWVVLASDRKEPLTVTLGQIDTHQLQEFVWLKKTNKLTALHIY